MRFEGFEEMARAAVRAARAFQLLGRKLTLAWTYSPGRRRTLQRRWRREDRLAVRDLARRTRRPSLIHKGGKP